LSGEFGSEPYAKEELRAEISSCFLANDLGIPSASEEHNKNHVAYVKSWIKVIKDDPSELMRAIKDADKISAYIKEKGKLDEVLEKNITYNEPDISNERKKENNNIKINRKAYAYMGMSR
jgi:antirestriction protein ArdC